MNALSLIRQWSDLPAPLLDDLVGIWQADFVPPLRHVAPVGLGLIGLPRWYGKRFAVDGGRLVGINLLHSSEGGLEERFPMRVSVGTSAKDSQPIAVVSYAPNAPRPWRWVRDELRILPDGRLLGMSSVNVPLARRLPLPFLLALDAE